VSITVAILACFAFLMGAVISARVFERLPHLEDEIAYLFQARVFAGGQTVVDIPQHPQSFWQPFVVDYEPSGKRFGKYPPGWPALLAIGVVFGREWLVNALFGALTVVLVYRIGREVYGRDVGLIAAVLTAFSPAALLLNGTLMAHPAALFFATLFMWSFWRTGRERSHSGWAVAAGAAIGAVFVIRPLSAIAVGLPFLLWGGVRAYADRASSDGISFRCALRPLALTVVVALAVASAVPLFSLAATGDARTNLYQLVWPYDSVGFGEGHGRTGHTLAKGFRHARFDLSLTAADLFGWQLEPITPQLAEFLVSGASSWPARGFSFVLLPIGALLGLTAHRAFAGDVALRFELIAIWLTGAVCWLLLPRLPSWFGASPKLEGDPRFAWLWVVVALVWLLLPLPALARWRSVRDVPFTWLLVAVALGFVILHVVYWTGSQRYSTRYYFEALGAAALLSAIPLARVAVRRWRIVVYATLVGVSILGLVRYSMPRIAALRGFNGIDSALIQEVEARRLDDRDQLVLVTCDGRDRWQWYGALLAVTSPYLDSDIVAARDLADESTRDIVERFPGRQLLVVRMDETGWSFPPMAQSNQTGTAAGGQGG
jgi:4-amino-4-deoxy-L-arabinose transferase-like glycosyltransferase